MQAYTKAIVSTYVVPGTQVVWPITENTWEPSSSLPTSLVSSYEAGIAQEIHRETFTSGGHTIHTLVTMPTKDTKAEPSCKRQKTDTSEYTFNASG